jgi:hypothetical protein
MTLLSVLLACCFLYAAVWLRRQLAPSDPGMQDADGPWVAIVQAEHWMGPALVWQGYFADEKQARGAAHREAWRFDNLQTTGPEFGYVARIEDRRIFERRIEFGYAQSFDRALEFSRFQPQRAQVRSKG